jgi:hypothetical protein
MKEAGMPVDASACFAAAWCCCTKPSAPCCGTFTAAFGLNGLTGVRLALSTLGIGPGLMPIWRSSWRAITSDKPPCWPDSLPAHCESSISEPSLVPSLSIMPLACDDSRMVLSSCCMNSDSNCLAASRTTALGSLPAATFRSLMPRASP